MGKVSVKAKSRNKNSITKEISQEGLDAYQDNIMEAL
jgi:hypothetical protein